ncbi:outer membrane beta-barrel protein [Mucilaginibacter antarcticus]|uniref:outer membrane beta-barrel protein n=1 Tax=Mucilaginibacter antarcticus TaxID=1855725 RepID=UPI00362C4802
MHYDGKWNTDKQSVNADYKTGAVDNNIIGNTLTQNNQPGNYNRSLQDRTTHDYNSYQVADLILNSKIDSTTTVSLSANGRDAYSESQTLGHTDTHRANGVMLNDNSNKTDGKNNNRFANTFVRLTKRLAKPGRSIGLSASGFFNESKSQDYVSSVLRLYNDQGIRIDSTVVNQYKPYISNSNNFSTSVSFSDQLFKGFTATATYGLSGGNTNQSTLSYNKSAANIYDVFDPTFSSDFSTRKSGSSYNLFAVYRKNKVTANVSGSYSATSFKQTDHLVDTMLTRHFDNWRAYADLYFQLTKAASITLNYNGNTSQPSITQIQPLRQNTDQLNITIGNPVLKPEFNNSFNLNYRVYRSSADQGMNFRVNYSTRLNAILRNRITDTISGINTYQWTNLKEKAPPTGTFMWSFMVASLNRLFC